MGKSINVFEVTLKGFDASTDETDYLIKWVASDNETAVRHFCEEMEWDWREITEIGPSDCGPEAIDGYAPWLEVTYECDCGEVWTDEWSCACDDRCPSCGSTVGALEWLDHTPTFESAR